MNKWLLRILNFCTVFFLPLAALPLLVIYHTALTGLFYGGITPLTTDRLLLQLLFCELCGFAGRFCGLAADKSGITSAPRRILAVPVGAIVGAAMYFLFTWLDPMAAPAMAALGTAAFWAVGGLRFYTYGDILSLRVFYGYLTEYAIVLVVLELFKINPCGPLPFAIALFAGLLMVLLGSNQAGIDFMMERRHHRFDSLPGKIRSYNIRLFGITAAGLLALLLLYRPIAWLLGAAKNGLLAALKWILGLLPEGGTGDLTPVESQTQTPQDVIGELGKGETSPFWTYFGIALAIGGVYMLYYYRHEIYMGLRSAWRAMKAFVQRLLWGGRQKADCDENEYYIETDEKIESNETDVQQKLAGANKRKWRRACRRFASEPDSPESLRKGYRLILQGIALQGVPVAVSDTTLEICQNAFQNGLPPIDQCTSDYNFLRYGEKEFRLSSMADLRTALSEILHYRKNEQ